MLHIIKAKFFRRPNILVTTIYLIFAPKYVDFHLLDTLYGYNSLLLIWSIHFWKKAPKMLYLIFFTKICGFSFFGHPVWLKYSFNGLAYPLLKKDTQNAQLQKGKTFQETQYFAHVHISHFFHQNMSIFIFWTTCMAKIAFYWLGLSILE